MPTGNSWTPAAGDRVRVAWGSEELEGIFVETTEPSGEVSAHVDVDVGKGPERITVPLRSVLGPAASGRQRRRKLPTPSEGVVAWLGFLAATLSAVVLVVGILGRVLSERDSGTGATGTRSTGVVTTQPQPVAAPCAERRFRQDLLPDARTGSLGISLHARHSGDPYWSERIGVRFDETIEFVVAVRNFGSRSLRDLTLVVHLGRYGRFRSESTVLRDIHYPAGRRVDSDALVRGGLGLGDLRWRYTDYVCFKASFVHTGSARDDARLRARGVVAAVTGSRHPAVTDRVRITVS